MNIAPKYEDVVANLDAALGREDALREELSTLADDYCEKVDDILDLQQRLTVAEQRVGELEELLRDCVNEFSTSEASQFELEMLNKILAALKPAAEQAKSCPNCKVCMGSPDFPENCLINGVKP